jgi:hypothetical protein
VIDPPVLKTLGGILLFFFLSLFFGRVMWMDAAFHFVGCFFYRRLVSNGLVMGSLQLEKTIQNNRVEMPIACL